MRNRNKIVVRKKPLAALLLAGVVLLGMSVPVSADELDLERGGSVTVQLEDLDTDRSQVKFNLYKVADPFLDQGNLYWNLDERLADSNVELNDLDTGDKVRRAAELLEKAVADSGIAPVSGVTDSQGEVSFRELVPGMYLLGGTEGNYGITEASLVSVPGQERDEKGSMIGWIYDVNLIPKAESQKTPVPEKPEKPDTPVSNTPGRPVYKVQTDDTSSIGKWAGICFLAGGTFFLAVTAKRKSKNK